MRAPKPPADVAAVFASFPKLQRARLREARTLIFEAARSRPEVGHIIETLRWREPAYLTDTGSGGTIRLGLLKAEDFAPAILFNCQSTIIESCRERFPGLLVFSGNRAIVLNSAAPLPTEELTQCLAIALTYHVRHSRSELHRRGG